MVKVIKEFRHAVEGYDVRTFKVGEQDLPPDSEAYARREGFIEITEKAEEHKAKLAQGKARDRSPENKAIESAPENKQDPLE